MKRVEIEGEYILPSARDVYLELYELLPHAYSTCYSAFDVSKKLHLNEIKPKKAYPLIYKSPRYSFNGLSL